MKPIPRSTAKDVFSHLLTIVTLYVGVISFIALYFQYVNIQWPDALDFYYTGSLDIIRQSMASVIVVWPVFILISWLIAKDLKAEPEKHEIGIRKWLLYLTLFITSMTMIIDLITLVNYFLNGEITTRFILKVLIVLITAGAVFWYYLWDLRRDADVATRLPKNAAIVTSVVILLTIILGFVFVGSPARQRQIRFDEQRISELSTIQNEIVNYYDQEDSLPENLAALENSLTGFYVPVDPETAAPYEYIVTDELKFSLCATFSQPSIASSNNSYMSPATYYYGDGRIFGQNWDHEAGRVCFDRELDLDMFKDRQLK